MRPVDDSNAELLDEIARLRAATTELGHFRELLDYVRDLTYTHDLSGEVTWVNHAVEQLTGYTRSQLLCVNIRDLFVPEHADTVHQALDERLGDGCTGSFEAAILTKENSRVNLSVQTRLLFENGRPSGIAGIGRVLPSRKQVDERTQRTERDQALGLIAGGVAHDFNNLLMAIIAYAETLKEETDASQLQDAADVIQKTARRGIQLANQLLGCARGARRDVRETDLHETLREVIELLKQSVPHGINICEELQAAERTVMADPAQMYQVFLNLGLNARDAMATSGVLTFRSSIECSPLGHVVKVSVIDTGHGIAPDVIPHIFEPFYTTKEPDKGTGLGLALVSGILRSYGGRVEVHSEQGRGATFNVYLPLARNSGVCMASTRCTEPAEREGQK